MGVPADGGRLMPNSIVLVLAVAALAVLLVLLSKEARRG